MKRIAFVAALLALGTPFVSAHAADPAPPAGFQSLFNGKDLAGWYGLNPHAVAKGDKRDASLKQMRDDFAKHWRVEGGELVNSGTGPYATTDREFGDCELLIEYKTVAGADSGIYLRGTPQVQIWDISQKYEPKRADRNPHLGSGGLFNNTPRTPGRDPRLAADKPLGEWNAFRIRQIGARTWIWLNDKLVVDGAELENFWDRTKPLPAKGPIMLQTHGGEIRWRNIFIRELTAEEAASLVQGGPAPAAAPTEPKSPLAAALAMHASFDSMLDADFSTGDRGCYVKAGKETVRAAFNEEVKLDSAGGRFGGALHFTRKGTTQPRFSGVDMLGYNAKSWSTTVSVWLRLTPDQDLQPGYCDPVQLVGDDSKKGFIFLEWSKDETPRFFRYAIRPLFHIWNPTNVQWADIPFEKRPMVQVANAPFSRERWTHVVFTVENLSDKSKKQSGKLYMDGKLQGSIDGWDLTFDWDPKAAALVLGASYVGHLDDLAVFNRVLTEAEVKELHALPNGVKDLR
jgi:hypothetical protein